MRTLRCLLAAAALVAAVPSAASAQGGQGGLSTDVRIAEVPAQPGAVVGDRVKTVNLTGRSLRVGVLIRDVGAAEDGEPISVPRGTGARSAAAWVSLNPSQFELGAGATRDVAIRISVPAGTKPGGYFASVRFEAAGVETRRSSEHLILVRVAGAGAAADPRIVRFRMPTLSVGGPVDLDLEVANAGNVHAVVAGSIQIKDTFGNRVGTLAVPNAIVLPGHQRLLTVRWSNPPPLARVRAVVDLQLVGRNGTAAASGYSLAWWVIAAAAGAFALPAYGIAGRRRRRRRKEREAAEAARRPAPPVVPLAPPSEGAWPGAEPEEEKRRRRRRGKEAPAEPAAAPPAMQPPPAPTGMPPQPTPRPKPVPAMEAERPAGRPFAPAGDEEAFARPPTAGPSRAMPVVVPPGRGSVDEPLIVHEEPEADLEEPGPEPIPPPEREPEPEPEPIQPRRKPEPAAEEPSWAPVEESEEFEEWLEAVRSAESDLEVPQRRPEPRLPEHPMPIARPPLPPAPPIEPRVPEGPVPVVPPPSLQRPVPVARAPEPEEPPPVAPTEEPQWPEAAWPDHEPAPVPSAWQAETGGEALTGAAALRRAKVALDMLVGPTGETGAILDAGLELLRSVASDPAVAASVQNTFAKAKGRRKQGSLALALAVVSAPEAPAALLAAYATAPKVVADRLQVALEQYDTAELRSNPELLDALPPARRYALGV